MDVKDEEQEAGAGDNGENADELEQGAAGGEDSEKEGADGGAGEATPDEVLEGIKTKLDAGEELTPEEQKVLDAAEVGEKGGSDELTAEEQALLEKVSPKMQKRLSELAQANRELKEQVAQLAETKGKSGQKPISEFTEQELLDLESTNPDYRPYVLKELARREARKVYDEGNKASTLQAQKSKYDNEASEKYPDLLDENSTLYKLAAKIYVERGYKAIVDGSLVAAQRAAEILGKKQKSTIKSNQARLSEIKKKGLGGAGRPAAGTSIQSSKLDALEEKAQATRPGSMEWNAVFKERRRLKELKAKGKG